MKAISELPSLTGPGSLVTFPPFAFIISTLL